MMRATCLFVMLALMSPSRLAGQTDSVARRHDGTSPAALVQRATLQRAVVHWGKWLAAAGAVAFTLMGSREHENSNREFERLFATCRADSVDCVLGPDGRYVNPESERLYQASIRHDRRARARLIAGQASLLVAAGLFIADLRHAGDGPGNKPFAPLEVSGDARTAGVRVAVTLAF